MTGRQLENALEVENALASQAGKLPRLAQQKTPGCASLRDIQPFGAK